MSDITRPLPGGPATFGVLFAVYAASLKVAELSVVTFGWIVFLQVGIVLLDTLHYGVRLPPGKWVAVGGLIALQAYLIIAPNAEAGDVQMMPALQLIDRLQTTSPTAAVDHTRTPFLDALRDMRATGFTPFFAPGHKRG